MELLQTVSILAVDDEPLDLMRLEDFLLHRCQQFWGEADTTVAFNLAQEQQPDVILLDILMKPLDGYQFCQRLKANPDTAAIPVIFLSSLIRPSDKVKGFQVGGVDYISKPFHIEEVVARVENVIRLHRQIHQKQVIAVQPPNEKIDLHQFSERELQIFTLYATGKQRNDIAQQLCISENTVKSHLSRLFTKLEINSRTQVVEKAYKMGLIKF
jgi:DNA-binding NarL/FixJ family response regulator